MNARRILLELFDAALRAVDGRACVARFLAGAPLAGAIEVFAIGKAASAMALGVHDAAGGAIAATLVITKDGHSDPALERAPGVTIMESAHPVPDARSLAAGEELRRRLRGMPAGVTPVFLISGGASSLAELLRDEATLEDLRVLNQQGLAAGWDIATLNVQRARLSQLKAGGVARLLAGRRAVALFISDVPGDDPAVIGSGLLGPDGANADAIERHVVANVEMAVHAVIEAAHARGIALTSRAARVDGDAVELANKLIEAARACESTGFVWGGESTVRLPPAHGRGGRNTHLALTFARQLRHGEPWLLLAAGTDGTDGPTGDAGAIVDAGSVDRATLAGCDVERAWQEFDSGTALEAAEDLVHTGPTGTNVGDILIVIKQSAISLRGQLRPRML
jgi:hydroxypyruvate reductase